MKCRCISYLNFYTILPKFSRLILFPEIFVYSFESELWTFPLHFIRCFCVVLSLCIDAAYTVFESRWHCCYLYAGFKRSSYKVLLCFISNRQYVRVWKLLLRYLLFIWGFQENVRRQNGRNRKLSFLSLYIICINMWMIIQTTNTLTQI